jgi:drug/metabolite transporter (DMT)-like permease
MKEGSSNLMPASKEQRESSEMKIPRWLLLAIIVPILWGVWGALIEIPEKWVNPTFPSTLGYVVWSFTMALVAVFALRNIHWKLEGGLRSVVYGCAVGFSGAAGQLLLFWVLTQGPAYIIFPIICLSPVVTIVLSATLLRERTHALAATGIVLSLLAIFFLSLQETGNTPVHGYWWLVIAIAIVLMWGLQAYFMKSSADRISSEGLFVYMAITAVLLCPIALLMTNLSAPINWGLSGLCLSSSLQLLNAIGALLLIYAIRWGKAIIVVPMINGLFPMVTIVLSLFIYHRIPTTYNFIGLFLAIVAIFLMAFDEVKHGTPAAAAPVAPYREPISLR